MAPGHEKSQLKRARPSTGEQAAETKKPRRSERVPSPDNDSKDDSTTDVKAQGPLPSPATYKSTTLDETKDTAQSVNGSTTDPSTYPSSSAASKIEPSQGYLSSPPEDTQPMSQFIYPPSDISTQDEKDQGIWGYLIPVDNEDGETMVLRSRSACPASDFIGGTDEHESVSKEKYEKQEERYEKKKIDNNVAGGYLIGRHPECDKILEGPTISNRHCLLFCENKGGDVVAMLEDLSSNGTFVNDALVGRNNRRELSEGDEIAIVEAARFIWRYPKTRERNGFAQQYVIQEQLGKGHFASVYLCIEKATGVQYAVKKFEKKTGNGERSKVEGLQQEIAVLMSVSHPSLLCLKSAFDEDDGVYIVLELASEGELFNWIVMKQKLSEDEARKVFIQLFQGVKYLHERNVVHRDIKPENILLTDKQLSIKLADFGLAKIIGEASFTTTLCGTPSYVAPEILESSSHRRYTHAVDIWSLGVVLYICLCGFPPFSDELNTPDNPYTLSQQIKLGRFDYPSPYWDSVHDEALDLIDRMLTVDYTQRATIDDCLQHPWTTGRVANQGAIINPNDSTDGLTGALGALDFSKRKPPRERTLLSQLNTIRVSHVVESQAHNGSPIKVFEKNNKGANGDNTYLTNQQDRNGHGPIQKESTPSHNRQPEEFMQMGGKGDEQLFTDDSGSRYITSVAK